jgi:serine/threonine-protein kinase
VPPAVAAFIAELTAKDPAARPASARLASARAAALRDSLTLPGASQDGYGPDYRAETYAVAADHPVTLADVQPPWYLDQGGGWPPSGQPVDRGWPRRRVALAIAAASILAGLLGWLLSSAASTKAPPAPAASSPAISKPSSNSPAMVTVDANALIGQPVSAVRDTLRGLGLVPQVNWVAPSDQSPAPDTVISVQPSGQVPAGSIVIVTAVQSQDHGNGNGDNGNGNGN